MQLQKMPQGALVFHLWDGEPRTEINVVYEAKNGSVITADYEMVCYDSEVEPVGVETDGEYFYYTPSEPNISNE
jgi:hypothetical protein